LHSLSRTQTCHLAANRQQPQQTAADGARNSIFAIIFAV
jgi:hypothetical protein